MDETTETFELVGRARLLVRVEEAALVLSLSRSKVYELMAAGDIDSVSIGRSRRIPMDGLCDYVKRLRRGEVN